MRVKVQKCGLHPSNVGDLAYMEIAYFGEFKSVSQTCSRASHKKLLGIIDALFNVVIDKHYRVCLSPFQWQYAALFL